MPEQNEYGFAKVGILRDLPLPSGGRVQIKDFAIEDLMGLGLIELFDQLGPIVQTEHIDRVKKPADHKKKKLTKAQQQSAAQDQDAQMLRQLMDPKAFSPLRIAIDRVCSRVIVQPPVEEGYVEEVNEDTGESSWVEIPVDKRDPDKNYPQQMQFVDKMHVFAAVLPSQADMARFREGSIAIVGGLDDQPEVAADA